MFVYSRNLMGYFCFFGFFLFVCVLVVGLLCFFCVIIFIIIIILFFWGVGGWGLLKSWIFIKCFTIPTPKLEFV